MKKADFDAILLNFAVDGGYALKTYERFKRLKKTSRGYTIASQAAGPPSPHEYRHHRGICQAEGAALPKSPQVQARAQSSARSRSGS